MAELTIEAKIENLRDVMAFAEEELEKADCTMKAMMSINVALEEMFVNISHYAYGEGVGTVTIDISVQEPQGIAVVRLVDSGVPFDPLAKADPDVTLSAEKRQIGGLGIFMVKSSMDHVAYERRDGKNIFTMEKSIR